MLMDNRKKACLAIILAFSTKRRVVRKRWVKDWLKKREQYSHTALLKEIFLTDADDYINYFRMNNELYNKLLTMVMPFLQKQDTNMRQCISADERLAVTLRYLATGRYFEDLKFSAIMSPAIISQAVHETCEALIYVLQDYMKMPTTSEEWIAVARDFASCCNFYNTVGAIDGKHIAITKPTQSGSMYFNYKGFYSIVLLAVVNAKREFITVDVGINGRISDGGVMFYSKFGALMQNNNLNLPAPTPLPGTHDRYPYVFVADDAFSLRQDLLKPFSRNKLTKDEVTFNCRLSAARASVENAFGILSSRFGVFQKAMMLSPEKATSITMACCYLHNFLSKENNQAWMSGSSLECENKEFLPLQCTNKKSIMPAKKIRNMFCRYYNNKGINTDCELSD